MLFLCQGILKQGLYLCQIKISIMERLNRGEHLNCYLYDNKSDTIIVCIDKIQGETFFLNEIHDQIIFLLKGKINFSCGHQINNIFEKGTFLVFPHGQESKMDVEEDSTIVIINLNGETIFCPRFPLEVLYVPNKSIAYENSAIYPLRTNEMISHFLNIIVKSVPNGLRCLYYQELKQKELLFYLRTYYQEEELAAFFAPILNNDAHFSKLIYKNYKSAKNVADLAARVNYSLSGFKKRFVKVFGISPRNWMEREKAKKIYYEINCTQKTFKEIAVEYDFSSSAHFDKFCKKAYGMSPGALRENNKKKPHP